MRLKSHTMFKSLSIISIFLLGTRSFASELTHFLEEKDFRKALELQSSSTEDETMDHENDILSDVVVRNALTEEDYLWAGGIIPYSLSYDYDDKSRTLLAKAVLELQNNTCIRFIPRTSEEDYIFVVPGSGCASYVGRVGGGQILSLGSGCRSAGTMMHELMHTLGFLHEQCRPDRDNHVMVKWENIKEGREANFEKWDRTSFRDLGEPYDYNSILHYSRFAFSKDPKKLPTLEPRNRGAKIGQRKTLSKGDKRKINKLYKCKTD